MGTIRRQTGSEMHELLALHSEVRQRMRAHSVELIEAYTACDPGRTTHLMADNLMMIRYASWIRTHYGYRAARLQLQPVPRNAHVGQERDQSVG